MKQSTFSAQVANNLLTVLQGYSKTIRLLLVMLLTLTVTTNAWGETVTFTPENCTNWNSSQEEQTQTIDGITFHSTKAANNTQLRLYSGATHTFTSSVGNITSILFTCTANGTSNYGPGKMSGDGYVAGTGKTGEWTGNSAEVTLTGGQSRCTSIVVTYTPSAGGGETPDPTTYTINWHTAVGTVEDEVLEEGATITKPATDPTMTGYVFMGWTEDCEVASDGAGFTAITNFGTATEDKDYYAVFAEATTTGGGGGSTTELFSEDFSSITSGNSTGTSGSGSAWDPNENFSSVTNAYQAGGAVKIGTSKNAGALVTKQLTAAIGETLTISFKVKGWSSVEGNIQVSGNNSEFAQPAAITYTSTMSGSFETKTVSVVLTKADPYIKIATTAKRAFIDDIVITKTTSGGGGSTDYDNYITTCSGSTPEPDPIPVTGVSLDITSHTMNEGETVTLTATVTPDNADDKTVSWESDDEAVAKVNTNGIVTAVSPGTATITVTTKDGGHTATCTITVNALPTVGGTWTLVTNAANLKAGDRIVIAAAESDFALSTTQNTNNRGQAAVTKNGNNITFTGATQIITLEAGTVDNTLAFNTGDSYLYAASSSSNYLKTQDTKNENGSWDISIADGVATVVAQGTNTRRTMQYNKTNGLFACYETASQQAIAIYKEGGGATTYTITSTLSHVTADGGNPTTITSEAEDLTLTYSAESGWNLPATISVTMGGTPLSSETDYDWDNGDLLIDPASGFTGNIVVTINGWKQLDPPTGLNVANITSSGATLSWSAVANASSYTVQVWGEDDEVIAEYPGLTEITKTVSELDPETNYVFGVVAVGDGITYTNSIQAVSDVFTTPAAAAPTAGYTIIHSRQALDDSYPDSLIVKTTGTADVGSKITAEKKTYTGFVCNDAVQTITIQEDAAQNVVTYKYVRQSYTLTWDLDGGNIIAEGTPAGTVKYGAPLIAPTVEKAGYRFDHWNPNVPATMQDGNRTYKAFYTQQHTVKWVSQGTVIRTDTYDTGAALGAAPTTGIVECDGKKHVGWTAQGGYAHSTAAPADLFTESSGTVTADATYHAVYAEGSGGGGTGWTAVTSTSDLEAGATYAISNAASGGTYLSTWDGGNNFDGSTITICPLILGGSEGAWTFQISDESTHNDKYLTATSATSNRLKAVNPIDEYSYFTISFDINGNAVITCTGKNTNNILRYNANNGSPIFACYSSGQDDVYLQKLTGGGGYTNYTTSCATITDIRIEGATTTFDQFDPFEFGGTVYAIDDEDNETDVTELATFTGYDMSQVGEQTVTVTYSGHQATYTITVNEVETWHITWNVSGATNTGIGPRYVAKDKTIGECSRTGDIQIPAVPTGCTGKTFIGWTESNTVPEDGVGITYINKDTKPDSDKTYYAVFATKEVGDGVALTQCNGSTAFEAGDKIVIVASGADWSYLCYQETSGTTYIAYSDFTNDAATLIEDDKNYWTLETATDGFYLGDVTNGYMYIVPSSNNMSVSSTNKSVWTIEWNAEESAFNIKSDRWLSCRHDLGETNKYKWRAGGANNTDGTLNLQVYKISGSTSYTDYSTSCGTYTVTFYGFNSGGYTTTCNDNPAVDEVEQGGTYVIPNCEPTFDPAELGRTFAGTWNTQANGKGTAYKPGDEIANVSNDITLYAQWALNTSGNTTLPTDVDDLATTDIIVTGGKTLTIPEGETITINSLTLKGGLLGKDSKSGYAMPSVVIPDDATLVRKNTTINLDLVVNSDSWYPFAVPFAVANNGNIDYLDPVLKAASTYNTHFAIKTYDGENRAIVGTDQKNNWDKVPQSAGLQPGKGYIISALTYPDKDTATIRIPMTVPNEWLANGEQTTVNEVTRNQVTVTAHAGAAATEHQRHAGWNFVANPYLSNFAGSEASNEDGSFITGELLINKGDYSYGGEDVPYVTIPTYNFAHYYQVKLSEATLSPAYSFFVQVGESGTMTFDVAGRQAAPASIAARNAEERPVKMDVDITLSDNHSSDQTGIIISDRYSDAYEIGRDLEKLFGSAYNLSVYTLMADNTPLAFQALAIRSSMQVIPVGYRAPEQGEYTFRLNEATSSIDLLNEQYEQLVLVDYQTGELTNLLIADYTFYSERTQADNRFAIYAVPRQNAPTDLPNAIGQDKQAQKILHNGHLYILRDGNVYNGNGQIVK